MTLTDAVKRMRGPKGSKIHLTLHRKGVPELFTVSVDARRHQDKVGQDQGTARTVTTMSASRPFEDGTDDDLEKALDKFRRRHHGHDQGIGARPARQSRRIAEPGGVRSSDDFLDGGLIVYTQGRAENQQQKYFAHKKTRLRRLSDGGAGQRRQRQRQRNRRRRAAGSTRASSSWARRPSARAPCRPSCRSTIESALRLTTARYYTPNGRSIQAVGITPDVDRRAAQADARLARGRRDD